MVKTPNFGTTKESFIAAFNTLDDGMNVIGFFNPTGQYLVFGRKSSPLYAAFICIVYDAAHNLNNITKPLLNVFDGVWTWNNEIV